MSIEVTPVRGDNLVGAEAFSGIAAAAMAHDVPDFPVPSTRAALLEFEHDWPGQISHRFLATDAGRPVGSLAVSLPQLENTHLADVEILVHPEHRRHGLGRTLYGVAVDLIRDHGRRLAQTVTVSSLAGGPDRDPAHGAFAAAMGAAVGLAEVRRRLDLDTVDRSAWDLAFADASATASGYSLVRWTTAAPDDLVADVAALDSRLLLDAPSGSLDIQAERIDAGRVRRIEEVILLRGRRPYHVGARHVASGRLAAWTTITYDADVTEHAWQQITIVDPAHRGHRLGMLVKVENLRHALAHEPRTRYIHTWNAAENEHMIAINESVGFRPVDAWQIWQAKI